VLTGRRSARRAPGERGPLLQEQVGAEFVVEPAAEAQHLVDWVHRILEEERGIVIRSKALEAAALELGDVFWVHVFCESGLAVNVLDDPNKRAVGFKLSE